MSNIKLKNHNWDTTGVYDSTLGKTQKQVNADLTANKVDASDYAPETKTSEMTQSVGKDSSGKLWTTPVSSASIVSATEAWLSNNITQETGYVIDDSLSVKGAAGDAAVIGNLIGHIAIIPNKSDRRSAWPTYEIGSTVTFRNANHTYSYVNIIPVLLGHTYTITITNGPTLKNSSNRTSVVVDDNNVIFQTVSVPTVAGETGSASFTAYGNGHLILACDVNYIKLDVYDVSLEKYADELEDVENKINSEHNLIDYCGNGFEKQIKDDSKTDVYTTGYERYRNILTLNKSVSASGTIYMRINTFIVCTQTKSRAGEWPAEQGVSLKNGSKYKITVKRMSGYTNGDGNAWPNIYRVGESTNILMNTKYVSETQEISGVFIAENNINYNIVLIIDKNSIFEDCVYYIKLEECSCIDEQYVTEMNTTVESVINLMTEPCLIFPLLTDIHHLSDTQCIDKFHFASTIKHIEHFMNKIDCNGLICLGDITDGDTNKLNDRVELIGEIMDNMHINGKPLYFAIGNHDDFRYATTGLSAKELYSYYMRKSDSDVIFDAQSYGTNYYKDFPGMKTRLICFNSNLLPTESEKGQYGISQRTLDWTSSVLSSMPNDYIGMIITHAPLTSQMAAVGYEFTLANGDQMRTIINNSGKRCFVLCGHLHFDVAYHPSNDVMIIEIGCAKMEGSTSPKITEAIQTVGNLADAYVYGRSTEDETADLWDIVVLRPFSMQLDLIRFGAGVDRHFNLS